MKAYIYARISSDEQKSGYSIDAQLRALRDWTARNGYDAVEEFRDEGFTGSSFSRPGYREMRRRAWKEKPELILVYDWSRFSRSVDKGLAEITKIKERGLRIDSILQPVDLASPMAIVTLGMYLIMSQAENDIRRHKTSQGLAELMRKGGWPRIALRGYINTKVNGISSMAIDEKKAPMIREAYQMALDGRPLKDITRYFRSRGINVGKNYAGQVLRRIEYSGRLLLKSGEVIEGLHEGIVTVADWEQVQINLDGPKSRPGRRLQLRPEFPLKGHLLCPECGGRLRAYMAKGSTGRKFGYYDCRHHPGTYNAGQVHNAFEQFLENIKPPAWVLDTFKDSLRSAISEANATALEDKKRLEKEMRQLRQRAELLTTHLLDGVVDKVEYAGAIRKVNQRTAEIQDLLQDLGVPVEYEQAMMVGLGLMQKLLQFWLWLDPQGKHQFLSSTFPLGLIWDGDRFCRTSSPLAYFAGFDVLNRKTGPFLEPESQKYPRKESNLHVLADTTT